MRHQKKKTTLGRENAQRKALFVSLANNLIIHNRIKTTEVKAKALRPIVEKLVTKAKNQNLAGRRNIIKYLNNEKSAKILMEKIAPKYKDRQGGYLRILKMGERKGDNAKIVLIEFV
ncbi:50S ribosomal protein L17 [Patescibacteria group bacterium]|nr:50S ribosomal protein L17 [Patescibacteria group bacterium]